MDCGLLRLSCCDPVRPSHQHNLCCLPLGMSLVQLRLSLLLVEGQNMVGPLS